MGVSFQSDTHPMKRYFFSALLALSLAPASWAAVAHDNAATPLVLAQNYQVATAQNLSAATASATDPLLTGVSAGRTLWYKIPPIWTGAGTQFSTSSTIRSSTATATMQLYKVIDHDNTVSGLVPVLNPVQVAPGQSATLSYDFRWCLAADGRCRADQ
jgi:hypothetical protein